jgi:hypothetical protein
VVDFADGDKVWASEEDEDTESDWILENEREMVVDPGAREVVAKLGAAAAAKAGSNRAAICQSCNIPMRVIPSQLRQTKGGNTKES